MSKLKEYLSRKKLKPEHRDLLKKIEEAFVGEIKDGPIKKEGFSASSLFYSHGQCPRYWSLLFKGVDESHSSWAYYNVRAVEAGSAAHESLQGKVHKAFGYSDDVVIEDEFWIKDPSMHGFIDVYFKDLNVPMEWKTANNRGYEYRKESNQGADYHLKQLLVYMYVKKADFGILAYENRDSFEPLLIPVIMTDEMKSDMDRIFRWMRTIEKARFEEKLVKVFPGKRVNSKKCQTCPIKSACDAAGEGDVEIPLQEKFEVVG